MAQTPANKEFFTFIKGIITEANPLTFPENASIDEKNFVLERSGARKRRLGMDYEDSHELKDTSLNSAEISLIGISSHTWRNINENSELTFYIIQFGNDLFFFDSNASVISASQKNSGNPITLEGNGDVQWQSSSLGGRIVFTTGAERVYSLEYDEDSDLVTFVTHGLLVRDQWGVDDGLATDERPVSLASLHEYNLLNQGWGQDDPDRTEAYYDFFKNESGTGKFPSNADLVQAGKDINDDNKFNARIVARAYSGNTPAPKGHYIIDLFDRSGTRGFSPTNTGLLNNAGYLSGFWRSSAFSYGAYSYLLSLGDFSPVPSFAGIPVDQTVPGVTVTAPYGERIFYSGLSSELVGGDSRSPLLGHLVFFTQLVDSADKVGKCYQEADPTSEDQSDLLATDGGFIKIPEMSKCLKLIPFSNSLVVFADNGVWEITGGEDGFSATTFQVIKITDIGAAGVGSIISVEDRIYYWSRGGIYTISRDQVSLALQITNISETTIQTLFETFSLDAVSSSQGSYDTVTKQIRWLLNTEDDYDGVIERFRFSTELVFDVVLEAFYPAKLPETDGVFPYIAGSIDTPGFVNQQEAFNVVIGSSSIVVGALNVTVPLSVRTAELSKILYLTILPETTPTTYKYTFSSYSDGNFEDWATHNGGTGIDADAFLLTGYETGGDTQRQKQAVYITNHFLRTETGFVDTGDGNLEALQSSSCLVQSQWDFSNSAASGKFGPQFQAYRLKRNYIPSGPSDLFDYGYEVITTKSKLRGRGRALSLLFNTEPRKDLIMLGWGIVFGVNTNV